MTDETKKAKMAEAKKVNVAFGNNLIRIINEALLAHVKGGHDVGRYYPLLIEAVIGAAVFQVKVLKLNREQFTELCGIVFDDIEEHLQDLEQEERRAAVIEDLVKGLRQ